MRIINLTEQQRLRAFVRQRPSLQVLVELRLDGVEQGFIEERPMLVEFHQVLGHDLVRPSRAGCVTRALLSLSSRE